MALKQVRIHNSLQTIISINNNEIHNDTEDDTEQLKWDLYPEKCADYISYDGKTITRGACREELDISQFHVASSTSFDNGIHSFSVKIGKIETANEALANEPMAALLGWNKTFDYIGITSSTKDTKDDSGSNWVTDDMIMYHGQGQIITSSSVSQNGDGINEWKEGDIVTVTINLTKRFCYFKINGQKQGESVPLESGKKYYPAMVLQQDGCQYSFAK